MPNLFIFQIGPVQPFIAAGRRTQDLYVGSRMLSELAKAGLEAANSNAGFSHLFPVPLENGKLPVGVPHRFAFISEEDPATLGERVHAAILHRWESGFADRVRDTVEGLIGGGDWIARFNNQKSNWIEIYWVASPYSAGKHRQSIDDANRALAQRKMLRHFPQVEEPGRKCTLTGAQSALNFDWTVLKHKLKDRNDIQFRAHEFLGAVAFTKRLAQMHETKCDLGAEVRWPKSTHEIAGLPKEAANEEDLPGRFRDNYVAVLHMDGDRMGERLSAFESIEDHQSFSRRLAHFADEDAQRIIEKYGGENAALVYAGGDDVLALLPISNVLECARQLRTRFEEITQCKASAGIAITPYDYPLDAALELAREAEEMAKGGLGRDAVVVMEAHGTNALRYAGGKWEALDLVQSLYNAFRAKTLSSKFAYDLLNVADELTGIVPRGAREAEVTRLLRRRTAEGASDAICKEIEALAPHIVALGDTGLQSSEDQTLRTQPLATDPLEKQWLRVAHWAILARFLAQPGRGEAI